MDNIDINKCHVCRDNIIGDDYRICSKCKKVFCSYCGDYRKCICEECNKK